MELILSRFLNPAIIAWIVIAFVSFTASILTICLMILEVRAHPAALNVPMIREMKRHDIISECVRATSQLVALTIGLAYVVGDAQGQAVVWALVAMNATLGFNSVNGLVLTLRLLGGIPLTRREPISHISTK